jgi:perosamine synthetase
MEQAMFMDVPLCKPCIGSDELDAVVSVLKQGWLAHGEFNHRFEKAFCELLGLANAVSLNSCTSALELALKANNIGGEVIVPSMTWVATANAVVNCGATPVFCDVDVASRNVTAADIESRLSPRTESVIPVHFGGQPCALDDIAALCAKRNLLLIEDSAETLGATWQGRQAGTFGIGCFSFFPTKNITSGEGGMLATNDSGMAAKVRTLASHGVASSTFEREKRQRPWLRAATMPGHNYRLSNVLAAIGYHQLRRLADMNAARIAVAGRYDEAFANTDLIEAPKIAEGATHVYQMYTVRVDAAIRTELLARLRAQGIGASVHFDPPVHRQPYYLQRYPDQDLPATEELAATLVTLPMFPQMTEAEQSHVIGCVLREVEDLATGHR